MGDGVAAMADGRDEVERGNDAGLRNSPQGNRRGLIGKNHRTLQASSLRSLASKCISARHRDYGQEAFNRPRIYCHCCKQVLRAFPVHCRRTTGRGELGSTGVASASTWYCTYLTAFNLASATPLKIAACFSD